MDDLLQRIRAMAADVPYHWTDAERAWLREHYHQLGVKACARHLRRRRGAVLSAAYRMGLCRPPRYTADRTGSAIVEASRRGLSQRAIARAVGCSRTLVAKVLGESA